MAEQLFEKGLNAIVNAASRGRLGVETTPEYVGEQIKVVAEKRNLTTRIYDSTNLFIIDDEQHCVVPRFRIVRR